MATATLLAPIHHCFIVLTAETKRLVTYRAQFWFELILSSAAELAIAIALWTALFQGKEQIGGYTLPEMVLYLIIAVFFGKATQGTGIGTLQREIYGGTFSKFLIYPLSVYSYKLGTYLPRSLFSLGQLVLVLIGLLVLGYWPEGTSLSVGSILVSLLALLLACILYFLIIMSVEAIAFWADQVWALTYALQVSVVFLSGKAIPLELFPVWAQELIAYSPFQYFAYFPTKIFLSQLPFLEIVQGFGLLACWIVAFFFLSSSIINRGLRSYTGVGQ